LFNLQGANEANCTKK